MKKFLALLLTILCVMGAGAISACNDDLEEIDSIIKNEEEWNNAFENLEYVNFSMRVNIVHNNYTTTNYCEVSETAVYYNLNNNYVFYSVKNEDGTYTTYRIYNANYEGNIFMGGGNYEILNDTSDEYFTGACTETVLKVSYADYFELFSYDEENGSYFYEDKIETLAYSFDGRELGTVYCFNNEIKTQNNKIISIKCDYSVDDESFDENSYYSLEYFNIGSTVVTVPEEVIKNASKEN